MVGSFPGCCARAASGHAIAVPPSSIMNLRRFIPSAPCGTSGCCQPTAFPSYRTGIIKCSYGVSGHMTYGSEVSGFGLLG